MANQNLIKRINSWESRGWLDEFIDGDFKNFKDFLKYKHEQITKREQSIEPSPYFFNRIRRDYIA